MCHHFVGLVMSHPLAHTNEWLANDGCKSVSSVELDAMKQLRVSQWHLSPPLFHVIHLQSFILREGVSLSLSRVHELLVYEYGWLAVLNGILSLCDPLYSEIASVITCCHGCHMVDLLTRRNTAAAAPPAGPRA